MLPKLVNLWNVPGAIPVANDRKQNGMKGKGSFLCGACMLLGADDKPIHKQMSQEGGNTVMEKCNIFCMFIGTGNHFWNVKCTLCRYLILTVTV